jgi:environmental stress-induced protein Ves
MRILRAENYRRMPWKNGGGETTEIAAFPEGAGLDDFDWRVSMAQVERGGPFSSFPGVDRTLSILQGEGIVLDVEGRERATLRGDSAPYSFPGDAATGAELLGGPITDLNVMTRRMRCRHKVSALEVDGPVELPVGSAAALLFCRSGSIFVGSDGGQLGRLDAAILDEPRVTRRIEGRGSLFLVEFSRL